MAMRDVGKGNAKVHPYRFLAIDTQYSQIAPGYFTKGYGQRLH